MRDSKTLRLRYLLRPRDETNRPDLQLLSVYRDHGVVPKSSRFDNFNKTPLDVSRYQVVEVGDLVVNKMKAWQGSIAVSRFNGIVSPDYLVCSVNSEVCPQFLHYMLRSQLLINEFRLRSKGIRPSQWRLYWEDLAEISVELPHPRAQRRIADFLDIETARITKLIDLHQGASALLKERRAALVFSEVTGHLHEERRETSLKWAESLPRAWQEVQLSLVARMGSGHTPSRTKPEWWMECTIPWITTGEVNQVRDDRAEDIHDTREKISLIGIENSSAEVHPAGTTVLCRTASAGYSAVMGSDMATSQDFVTWTCGPLLDPYYLLWCLRAMRSDLLGRLAMGSTHKTIYVPDLQMLKIPLPELQEQRNIVQRIRESNSRIDRLVDSIEAQSFLLVERQQALITAAVTGQQDVVTADRMDVS